MRFVDGFHGRMKNLKIAEISVEFEITAAWKREQTEIRTLIEHRYMIKNPSSEVICLK